MKRCLLILFFVLFVAMIGFGITLPALPFFVERLALNGGISREAVAFHVGALTSAYAITQLGLAPLWGRWSDRIGRKPLVIIGLGGFALAQAVFGLGTSLTVLYGARLVGGVFAAALLTTSAAVVADCVPEDVRSWGMAWRNTAISLGVVVGPALSGLLARTDLHFTLSVYHFTFDGFSIPFLAAAVLAVATIPVVMRWLPESLTETQRAAEAKQRIRWIDLGIKLKGLLGLVLVSQFALALFEAVFALYAAQKLNFGLTEIGYAFAVCGLVMALFQGGVVGYLTGRISENIQIVVGFVMMGAGLWLLLIVQALPVVLGTVGLQALGLALISPNLLTLIANRSEPYTGAALGLQNASSSLGQVTGPLLGGLLFGLHADIPFEIAGGLTLVIAISMAASSRFRTRQSAARELLPR